MDLVTLDYNGYTITTDKSLMKVSDIHRWLSEEAYWCKGIPLNVFKTSFDNSYCIGAIFGDKQVGFAKLMTDYATFGYLADVFVLPEHRGKGISKKMMELLLGFDWVKSLRVIRLATTDAHGLYRQFGFRDCKHPEKIMEIVRSDVYKKEL